MLRAYELGRLLLCGSLFIAYRHKDGIKGEYAVCVLYETSLVVARARDSTHYDILVVARAGSSSLEEADNGKGWYSF